MMCVSINLKLPWVQVLNQGQTHWPFTLMNRVLRTRDKNQLKMEILLQHISIKETYPWCSSGAEVNNTLRKRQEKKSYSQPWHWMEWKSPWRTHSHEPAISLGNPKDLKPRFILIFSWIIGSPWLLAKANPLDKHTFKNML